MSTCDVIDTEDWQGAGFDTIGAGGLGVLGSAIASAGTNGPGYAYNDLALPADSGKEICGRITSWPAVGTLYAYEDTSFTYTRTGDGAASFQYQLYVDGLAVGTPQTVALTVGAVSATAAGATLTGAGAMLPGTATGAAAGTAPGVTLEGTAQIIAGTATGGSGAVDAQAPGCELVGLALMTAGTAQSNTYARAPDGAGYAPRRTNRSNRPCDIQGTYR